jgi:Spy/CpxP family protein refolding chaperone
MTAIVKRMLLGVGASAIALGVSAGVYASAQNTSQAPPPFSGQAGTAPSGGTGRFGGPGGRGRFGGPGGPMGMLPMFGRQLGLSDAQKAQVKAMVASNKADWTTIAGRERTAHQALNAAVTADQFDETLIRSRSADVSVVDADMAVARARAYDEFVQILTPDQVTKLKAIQANMQNRMKAHQQARQERHGRILERFGL